VKDSQWLAQLMEVGLLRGSFLPPGDIRAMRDLTRYLTKLIKECSREKHGCSRCRKWPGSSWTTSPRTPSAYRAG
jgi:hypothetical protein